MRPSRRGGPEEPFAPKGDKARASALGAFEVAFLDLQGQVAGLPLHQILGGAVRDRVPYSAYLFYKFGQHKDDPGYPVDDWGEAITHDQMVEQARRMCGTYGFGSIKLKGGVFEPDFEIETLRALRRSFPDAPLRIDPNGGWSVATTRRVMPQLSEPGLLEYLEDPCGTLEEMGEVAGFAPMPLATNMVTVAFGHIPKSIRLNSVQVILSDHHYWGGLRATAASGPHRPDLRHRHLDAFELAHGHQPRAMTHVGATIPNLAYACDTHYPWQEDEVIDGGKLTIADGCVALPRGRASASGSIAGAGAALHQNYLDCGIRVRNDAAEMRKYGRTGPTSSRASERTA